MSDAIRTRKESQLLESSATPHVCTLQGITGSKRKNNTSSNEDNNNNKTGNNLNEQIDTGKRHCRGGTSNGQSQSNFIIEPQLETYLSHPLYQQHRHLHSRHTNKKLLKKSCINIRRKVPNIELSKTFSSSSSCSGNESDVDAERYVGGLEECSDMFETSQHHSCPPALCRPRSSQSSGSNASSGRTSQHLGVPSVILGHNHNGNDNILSFSECNLCSEYDWSSQKALRRNENRVKQQQPPRTTIRSPSVSSQSKLPFPHPTSSHRLSGTFRFLFSQTRRFSTASQQNKLAKHDQHHNCYQFYNKRHRASEAGGHASSGSINRTMATGTINSVISTAL